MFTLLNGLLACPHTLCDTCHMSVRVHGYLDMLENRLQAVLAQLEDHIRLELSTQVPGRLNVFEEFQNHAALQDHQDRLGQSDWEKVTSSIERYYEI